mmetsp:Transcript_5973/g.10447  ORF Transcript_5973/g.10447 Transcript_5973/m.10447 type:complete len:115 (+) Transcript_5973:53-397(+)
MLEMQTSKCERNGSLGTLRTHFLSICRSGPTPCETKSSNLNSRHLTYSEVVHDLGTNCQVAPSNLIAFSEYRILAPNNTSSSSRRIQQLGSLKMFAFKSHGNAKVDNNIAAKTW